MKLTLAATGGQEAGITQPPIEENAVITNFEKKRRKIKILRRR